MCVHVCVFITAGPSTKLFAWRGGYWRTCATRDDEPNYVSRLVMVSATKPERISATKPERISATSLSASPKTLRFIQDLSQCCVTENLASFISLEMHEIAQRCSFDPVSIDGIVINSSITRLYLPSFKGVVFSKFPYRKQSGPCRTYGNSQVSKTTYHAQRS